MSLYPVPDRRQLQEFARRATDAKWARHRADDAAVHIREAKACIQRAQHCEAIFVLDEALRALGLQP